MSLQHDRGFDLEGRLREREQAGLRRDLRPVDSVAARARMAADPGGDPPTFGEERLVLAANNYLGLAGDERVAEAPAPVPTSLAARAAASATRSSPASPR